MIKANGKYFRKRLIALATAIASTGGTAIMLPAVAQAEVSGNLSVVSEYLFRGGYENNGTAVQGGFDYANESGFYAGYWGSSLDYGDTSTGFENDLYVGFSGESDAISYDVGLLYYVYTGVSDADTPELYGSVGFGPVSFGAAYLLDDVAWGNSGDIYLSLGYEAELPNDFSFAANAGFYTYSKDGEFIAETAESESSGFKHLDLTLSHPLADTGADMSITYMYGGKDREGADVADTVIVGASFGF